MADDFFRGMGIKVVTGSRYLGGVHWGGRGTEEMAGRESRGMGGFRGDLNRGFSQAPAVRLLRTAEATPAGVGIFAAGHPWRMRRLRPGT